eukprot:953118-Alexandrium_andersonii.AAC.1
MSASLVGSEMCIRDSLIGPPLHMRRPLRLDLPSCPDCGAPPRASPKWSERHRSKAAQLSLIHI